MSGVDAVAIETVLEVGSSCADRDRAAAMLAASLAAARGPRRALDRDASWQLRMTVTAAGPGSKAAEAQIRDDRGQIVSARTVSDRTTGSCVALVNAVGAWAQIVLDDELAREDDEAGRRERDAETSPPESRPIKTTPVRDRPVDADESPFAAERRPIVARSFEVGTTVFLRNGAASSGGMFGVAPFVTVAIAEKWVVRPSVMYGTSTSRIPPDQSNSTNLSSFGGRLDFCGRVPGNYIDHRGIEFDVCMGGDVIHVWSTRGSANRGSIGPAATVRGELGHGFGLEFRTMAGVTLNRSPVVTTEPAPPFVTAFELGGSVRFQ